MQASGLALMSKALPFTLGQAKRIRLRKHAQRTNEAVKEIRGKDVPQLVKIFHSGATGLTDSVTDLKRMKYM